MTCTATMLIGAQKDAEQSIERERIAKLITMDVLNAVGAIFGEEGLAKVVDHARRENRTREDNAEIDALEEIFSSGATK